MPPEERDPAHLWDMREAANAVVGYTKGRTIDEFRRDRTLRDATERQLMTLGEAARRVSEGFRSRHPEIRWQKIIGLRNVLIHNYDVIDYADLWRAVTDHAPELIRQLTSLLPPPPSDESGR